MTRPREETQADLDRLSGEILAHTLSQAYTVADRVEEAARDSPDRPFVLFGDRRMSYAELNAAANEVAHAFQAAGVGLRDVVALMMENRPEFIVTWVGLAKLGVTTALLNTNVRGRPLATALAATDADHVVVGSECLGNVVGEDGALPDGIVVHVLRDADGGAVEIPAGALDLDAALADMSNDDPDPGVREGLCGGDDLFHIFTSGTTGLPKAARLSHMRWLGVGDGMSAIVGYGPDDVIACVLPLYHGAAGMVVVSSALSRRAAVFIRRRFSASRFWDDARKYGVTGWQYIGEICRYLLNQPVSDGDRDHRVRSMMGAGLGADIWAQFQERFGVERIFEGWSSTEANTSLINVDGKVGSCGRIPFKDRHNARLIRYDVESETHVRDERGFCIECEPGETGELVGMILDLPDSGAGRFEGYTSAEDSERKILRDVFSEGDRWYRSGDLLRCDDDGYHYFVDRTGDTFRWKSENVSTQEVAEALGGFPGLIVANVYGVQVSHAEGRAGMAALVLDDPDAFDGRAFYEYVDERLPGYAAPVVVRVVGEADMTSTFKLRKVDLQRDGYDRSRIDDPLYVRDDAGGAYVPLTAENLPS